MCHGSPAIFKRKDSFNSRVLEYLDRVSSIRCRKIHAFTLGIGTHIICGTCLFHCLPLHARPAYKILSYHGLFIGHTGGIEACRNCGTTRLCELNPYLECEECTSLYDIVITVLQQSGTSANNLRDSAEFTVSRIEASLPAHIFLPASDSESTDEE